MPNLVPDKDKTDQNLKSHSIAYIQLYTTPPAPPEPSTDQGMHPDGSVQAEDPEQLLETSEIDIFTLLPVISLKLLCSLVNHLVQNDGDTPPTPPKNSPSIPTISISPSEKDSEPGDNDWRGSLSSQARRTSSESDDVDGAPRKKTPIGSPDTGSTEPHSMESDMTPLYVQDGAITRKFYSKKPPSIPLEEYLLRLHRYCPMSTAVYLAAGLYIHRLVIIERIVPVTRCNAHRLLLASLRVAMKALEDLSYPHRRFAKVGGVSELELGRLEVSFCFLTNFELKVDKKMLHEQALIMKNRETLHTLHLSS